MFSIRKLHIIRSNYVCDMIPEIQGLLQSALFLCQESGVELVNLVF